MFGLSKEANDEKMFAASAPSKYVSWKFILTGRIWLDKRKVIKFDSMLNFRFHIDKNMPFLPEFKPNACDC